MRRSPSLFWAQLVSGMLAAGAATACKGPVLVVGTGQLAVVELLDGGVSANFDLGQACNGFTSTTTLYLETLSSTVTDLKLTISPASTFFTVTPPTDDAVTEGTPLPFTVTFNPPSGSNAAPESATLVVTGTNASNSPLSVTLTATVASAPANAIFQASCGSESNCTSLTFNNSVPINGTGSQTINVTNIGCPPLDVAAMLSDGGDPSYSFSGLTTPIAYHQKVPVTVTFSPTTLFGTAQELTFFSPINYEDGGLPYTIGLSGAGIAPVLVWQPEPWSFPGATVGQENCEEFTLTNTGSQQVTLNAPIVGDTPNGEQGVFTVDAGWASGFVLDAGSSVNCIVCVKLPDAGVVYTASLEAGYDQGGNSAASKDPLTATFSSGICSSALVVSLPDDNMLCGFETGSFELSTCTDGGPCINISKISWADGGNFDNLGTITGPTGSGPWQVCPDSAPLEVDVSIHDNGLIRYVVDAVEIDSDSSIQPRLDVTIAPKVHPVPRENGTPILIMTDAGPPPTQGAYIAGYPILFQIEGDDDGGVNFVYQYFYLFLPHGSTTQLPNGGIPSYFDAGPGSNAYGTDIWFTPNDKGLYTICPIMLEVDAGFGNCGFDAGDPRLQNPLCATPFEVTF